MSTTTQPITEGTAVTYEQRTNRGTYAVRGTVELVTPAEALVVDDTSEHRQWVMLEQLTVVPVCSECEQPIATYGHTPECSQYDWGTAECYECLPGQGVTRRITGEGPVVNHADPTQSYRLECGHHAI